MNTGSMGSAKKLQPTSKCKRLLKIIGDYITQFLSHTTLQGLIYVSHAHLSLWERAYFLICFGIVISVAINFATNVFINWESMPVIIAQEATYTSVYNTPFPAITVCNMNQALRSKTEHFPTHSLEYAMTQKICFQKVNFSQFDDLKPASKHDTITNFIARSGQTCDNMVVYCRYGRNRVRCSDYFREVISDEGICCAFNILHPSYLYKGKYQFVRDFTSSIGTIPVDWNLENGYADNLPLYYYPRKTVGAGVSLGFTLVLNANISEYICSSTFSTGLKIVTHNPIDAPHVKETGLTIQLGHQYRLRFNVASSKALPSTRSISPKRRQCLFNNELKLHYFRYYTRRNCERECDAMYFLRRCQCIPYYMPLIYPNASVCHVKDFNCEIMVEAETNNTEHLACKRECLPGCFDLTYFPTVYRAPLVNNSDVYKNGFFTNFTQQQIHDNLALVQVYFKDDFFKAMVRSPYTSFTDYLSQTGGIMSLMVGFGVMSVAEFCYFFLIRPIFDLVLKRLPGTRRVRRVVSGTALLLGRQQDFRARIPLATGRKPLRYFNKSTSPTLYNGLINKLYIQNNQDLNTELKEKGLFPYTE
ncbi:pickpocket protein 28 [Anastrepha ludens]|uniref:pickpocket protein 28 n=1 Tax=Anastrepha ludens TaxID=28586 RepID=UPI0023AFBA10|nr:pickpocket protein 28 [Anastrepha ludens]